VPERGSSDPEVERVARLFEKSGDPEFAARWRLLKSDAGLYLQNCAQLEERAETLLRRVFEIHAAVESSGAWERADEWRIGSPGLDRFEKFSRGFRATADYHGVFRAEFATFPEAFEAQGVFRCVQTDLFWALGWSTSPPKNAAPSDDDELVYLRRLSEEARADDPPALSAGRWEDVAESESPVARRITTVNRSWSEEPVLELAVTCRSLELTTDATTLERATEFLGIYERLTSDFARVLEWRWV
jgi:hypothetical protein